MLRYNCSQTAALQRKEVTDWTVNHVVDFTHGLEHYNVVMKSDQAHATKELINWVFRHLGTHVRNVA